MTVLLMADADDGAQRSSLLSINTSILFVGATVYRLIGGVLALRRWNIQFFSYLLAVPICVFAYLGLDESSGVGKRGFEYVGGAVDASPVEE